MNALFYSDTYTGPRWTYGLTLRPVASVHLPKGWIVLSGKPHADFRYGTIDFPRELTAAEIDNFDLQFVQTVHA